MLPSLWSQLGDKYGKAPSWRVWLSRWSPSELVSLLSQAHGEQRAQGLGGSIPNSLQWDSQGRCGFSMPFYSCTFDTCGSPMIILTRWSWDLEIRKGRREWKWSIFQWKLRDGFFLVEPQHSYRAWAVSQLAQEDRMVLLESLLSMDYSQYPVCAIGHSSQALPELLLGQISPKQMGCEEYMC